MWIGKRYKKVKTPSQLQQGWCSKNAARLRENITESERAIMFKLTEAGYLHYRFQQIFRMPNEIYFADFFLYKKKHKIVIEVDGGYHMTKKQQVIDRRKDQFYIANINVKGVIRINDEQAISISVQDLDSLISSIKYKEIRILYPLSC